VIVKLFLNKLAFIIVLLLYLQANGGMSIFIVAIYNWWKHQYNQKI